MKARELFEAALAEDGPLVLDVRNAEEHARWKVEGRRPLETLNLPYFDFIEGEERAVGEVRKWLAGRARPLAVVCATGDSSEFVAGILRDRGIDARNVEGGMAAWGLETVVRPIEAPAPVRVWQVHRFGRGCLSYVVAAGEDAIVVDPHRRSDEYRAFLRAEGLGLRAVLDTHLHADHVSGSAALAQAEGAPYFAPPADFAGASFRWEPLEGQALGLGRLRLVPLRVLHSPGHTPGSTCVLVNESLLLSGDTLFVGDVGRPDLGGNAAEWGRELHETLQGRLRDVPGDAVLLPAHSGGARDLRPDGTVRGRLGELRATSPSLRLGREEFLRDVVAGACAAPPAYSRMRRINLGTESAGSGELSELELGRNECALHRR